MSNKVATGITIPANPCWVRIREAQGTVYYEWSADGLTWTTFASVADPPIALNAVYPELSSGHWAAETDTNATFQHVNLPPPPLTPVASAATVAQAYVTGGAVQQMYPSSDLTATGWTPSSGTSLAAMLSDQADATYDFSPV